jgi:hypothetical protein
MSIINEALKKVQKNRQGQDTPPGSNPTVSDRSGLASDNPLSSPGMKTLSSATALPKNLLLSNRVLILLPLIILIIILVNQIVKLFPLSPAPKKETAPTEQIEVSGIMTMENKKMALINNEIYEIGDVVGGMTLMTITEDAVQMLKEGRLVSYKVKK